MVYTEQQAREELIKLGKSIFDRGLTGGASANISARIKEGFIISPTNSCIGFLAEHDLSILDHDGNWLRGEKPSKEFALHKAFYDERPQDNAVVHLHSTYATALSCLDISDETLFPPLTPYLYIRLGHVAKVDYYSPGDIELAKAVQAVSGQTAGVLMANHGPIVSATNLYNAMYAIEELEESAKLALLLKDQQCQFISPENVEHLLVKYGHKT
jgi:ribulose-5-phosphate 4-epimerase/fuculose-1-phosphate aldolase